MLEFLDVLLTVVHVSIILFNLFGWIPVFTRRVHFISIVLTAASWFLLGIPFGLGYCPFTDWQWQVKEIRGEQNMPDNFIEYFAEKVSGWDFNSGSVDIITAVGFALAALLSMYVNYILPKVKEKNRV